MAEEATQEVVTFFSWEDKTPSSQVVCISGGERVRDGITGRIMSIPSLQVKFNKGVLHTNDPAVIAALRRLAAQAGSNISEDPNKFYDATLEQPRREDRLKKQLDSERAEVNRLREELEAQRAAAKKTKAG